MTTQCGQTRHSADRVQHTINLMGRPVQGIGRDRGRAGVGQAPATAVRAHLAGAQPLAVSSLKAALDEGRDDSGPPKTRQNWRSVRWRTDTEMPDPGQSWKVPTEGNRGAGGRVTVNRVIRFLAVEAGVRQFLDVGTGLPTADNTHEVAQRAAPE